MRAIWIVIPIAIMFSALGGYILNAEEVETCETTWDYVTDISGAFTGDKSDIITNYNPSDNITGWALSTGYNDHYMDGVYTGNWAQPNTYFINGNGNGRPTPVPDTLTFTRGTFHNPGGFCDYSVSSATKGALDPAVAYNYIENYPAEFPYIIIPGAPVPPGSAQSSATYAKIYTISLMEIIDQYQLTGYDGVQISQTVDYNNLFWPGVFSIDDLEFWPNSAVPGGNVTCSLNTVFTSVTYNKITGQFTADGKTYNADTLLIGLLEHPSEASTSGAAMPASFQLNLALIPTTTTNYVNPNNGAVPKTASPLYWCNNQRNVSVSVVLSPTDILNGTIINKDAEFIFTPITSNGEGSPITIRADNHQYWTISNGNATINLGKWPALMLTYGEDITLTTISTFGSFASYTTASNIPISWQTVGGDLLGFKVSRSAGYDYDALRFAVVNSTIRIVAGGPYLQNGVITPSTKFPDSVAGMFIIGSAAHVGQSITFIGDNTTATFLASDRGLEIAGHIYSFDQIRFVWVSTAMPTQTIAGVTYPAAYYVNGQSYDAGWLYMEYNGNITEVVDGNNWSMRLDGVWAPAVNYYEGMNEADVSTQLMDFSEGLFRWDRDTVLVVFIGSTIGLMIAMSYFSRSTNLLGTSIQPVGLFDWAVAVGVVAITYLIL